MQGLLDLAVSAAHEAGALLRARFASAPTGLTSKSSATDVVSDADRAAEELLVGRLRAACPDDSIIGEEGAAREGRSGRAWLLDPLDGTVNFLYGIPHFCVSVACLDEGGAVVGVVHDPMRGETFATTRGAGATRDGVPIRVSAAVELATSLVATGFGYRAEVRAAQAALLARVLPRVRDVRRGGSAALDLAWLAAGRHAGYYEASLRPWDWAAGALLVREAGGRVEDLPPIARSTPGVIAAGPSIFDALRALVPGA
ncbi:MAG: inositol monophosphatase family protein [Deltaproteobacteria bacterium]